MYSIGKVRVRPIFIIGGVPRIWENRRFKAISTKTEGEKAVGRLLIELQNSLTPDATFLEEKVIWTEEDLKSITSQDPADLYIVFMLGYLFSKEILRLVSKPAILIEGKMTPLRALEAFEIFGDKGEVEVAIDYADVDRLIRVFRAKKLLRSTRVGVFGPDTIPDDWEVIWSANINLPLKRAFGITDVEIGCTDLKRAYTSIDEGDAISLAREWTRSASGVDVSERDILDVARLYLAIKGIIREREVNAVRVMCGPLVGKVLPWACFVISRLTDEGIPAICADDNPCALMLSYIANKPVFFGGPYLIEGDTIYFTHCTIPSRMGGYSQPSCPITLKGLTHHQSRVQHGVTAYIPQKLGEDVTIVSTSRDKGVLLAKGKIVTCSDVGEDGNCRISLGIRTANSSQLINHSYSHLFSIVYGEYTEEVKMLCRQLDIGVGCV